MSRIKKIAVSAAIVAALSIRKCQHTYNYTLDNRCTKCGAAHPLNTQERQP